MSEIPNLGGQGKTQPTGRGVPIGGVNQAPSGLSGPGRGVGIPNLMTMMPQMGRGVTPMQPRMQVVPQNIPNIQNKMPMGGMGVMQPGMIRPPMMNPMMVRPPQQQQQTQQNKNFQG